MERTLAGATVTGRPGRSPRAIAGRARADTLPPPAPRVWHGGPVTGDRSPGGRKKPMNGPVKVAAAAVRLLAGPDAPGPRHPVLAVVTLISWLLTASIGAYMLGTWIASGGLGKQ